MAEYNRNEYYENEKTRCRCVFVECREVRQIRETLVVAETEEDQ